MFGIDDVRKAVDVFSWVKNLGAKDTEKIRNELNDLIFHASTSLKTILEIVEIIEDFDSDRFDTSEFRSLYKVCRRFYLDPDALEKCRTHCTDLFRDANRIEFKLAKYGRTENVNVSELNQLIDDVGIAEDEYLQSFDENIKYLEESLDNINASIDKNDLSNAKNIFVQLRSRMLEDLTELRDAKKGMAEAENHIRKILT
jgi:hypothetical protein